MKSDVALNWDAKATQRCGPFEREGQCSNQESGLRPIRFTDLIGVRLHHQRRLDAMPDRSALVLTAGMRRGRGERRATDRDRKPKQRSDRENDEMESCPKSHGALRAMYFARVRPPLPRRRPL